MAQNFVAFVAIQISLMGSSIHSRNIFAWQTIELTHFVEVMRFLWHFALNRLIFFENVLASA